jgi:hypothetical protein
MWLSDEGSMLEPISRRLEKLALPLVSTTVALKVVQNIYKQLGEEFPKVNQIM